MKKRKQFNAFNKILYPHIDKYGDRTLARDNSLESVYQLICESFYD